MIDYDTYFAEGVELQNREFKRAMKENSNPNNIRIGDIIDVSNSRYPTDNAGSVRARVVDVHKRFRSDLIGYKLLDGSIHNKVGIPNDSCDQSYCTVVERTTILNKESNNSFFNDAQRYGPGCNSSYRPYSGSGAWYTSSKIMASLFWVNCLYGISEEKLDAEWEKAGWPGRVGNDKWTFMIRAKTFRKWLLRNINKVKRTKEEWVRDNLWHEDYEIRRANEDMDMDFRHYDGVQSKRIITYYLTKNKGLAIVEGIDHKWVKVPEGYENTFNVDDKVPEDWRVVRLPFGHDPFYDESKE